MASFPISLKTGAVAQYPLTTQVQFATNVVRFIDGSEQRFPGYATPLRRWTIRLDLLDEAESNAILDFFRVQSGGAGVFSFTDPADGTVYPNCCFVSDSILTSMDAAGTCAAAIVVQQNRS
jgi:phage-related protein